MALHRRPIFVLLGGPNGAGKSTMTPHVQIGPKIDPDYIAKLINPMNPDAAALPAAREAIRDLKTFKEQGRSFTYETTLASNAALKEIADARAKNYEIRLYFVALATWQQSARRVAYRVESGGHNIPLEAIHRRFEITFAHATIAAPLVDRFELIDNHKGETRSVLLIEDGAIQRRETSDSPRITQAIADIISAVAAARVPT